MIQHYCILFCCANSRLATRKFRLLLESDSQSAVCPSPGQSPVVSSYHRPSSRLTATLPSVLLKHNILGFLGRNGAGKTTTIKMLLGLTRPTSGAAHVLGMDVSAERMAILQRTDFVSEKKTLYPSLPAAELVRFSRGFYPTWSDSSVEKYARLLEIPMKQRFEKLSNGNQTKVWLLLALSQGADLLILDEPTTALDPVSVDQLLHVLAEDGLERITNIAPLSLREIFLQLVRKEQ